MKKLDLKLLLDIFKTFFKLGLVSFGGGYAMIPLIEKTAVEEKKWIDKEKVVDVFAVSESMPGAIALNSSGLIGYSIAGIPGSISALLGNVTPSVIIVLTLSILFIKFSTYPLVQAAFDGIRPAIIGLILYAAYKIGKTAITDLTCVIIMISAFTAKMFFHLHPITIIFLGAIAGIILTSVKTAITASKKANVLVQNNK